MTPLLIAIDGPAASGKGTLAKRLAAHFGKPPSKRVDPMLAVGLGAAICTRDLPWDDKTHRVLLRSRAEVWSKPNYTVRGRTSPDSKVQITGAAQPVDTTAGANGQFSAEVALTENATHDLTVVATAPTGESAKVIHRIRHDPGAGQTAEPADTSIVRPTLPRNIFLGLKEDKVALLIKHGTTLPTTGEIRDQFTCERNDIPFTLRGPVFEGHAPESEIPCASFNRKLGELRMECPPTPGETPLVVAYHIDDSRTITLESWFAENPSVRAKVTLDYKSASRDDMHLVERTESAVGLAGERLRPDEKARLNRKKQALIDLCESYRGNPSEDTRKQIVELGNELKAEIKTLELKYKI